MYQLLIILFIIPLLVSGLLLILPRFLSRILIIATAFILSAISLYLFISIKGPYHFGVPAYTNQVVAYADLALLFFFAWIAVRRKSALVGIMTILQAGALLYLMNGSK